MYLNYVENELNNILKNIISLYNQYVVDTILLFMQLPQAVTPLIKLSQQHRTASLKFTLDVGQHNKINFLDMTKEENYNRLPYSM